MNRRFSQLCLLLTLPLAACGDEFGPRDWSAEPDTMVLYSLSRPEHLGRSSAFDFTAIPFGAPREVESAFSSGQWDFALVEENGALAFAPAGSFQGQSSRAAIATVAGTPLAEIERAPDEDDFTQDPVVLQTGVVYVVRSRAVNVGLANCVFYSKLEVLELNQADGWMKFHYALNPNCNNRDLIPPDSD